MKHGSNTDNTSIHCHVDSVVNVFAVVRNLPLLPLGLVLIRVSSVFHPWLNAFDSPFFLRFVLLLYASGSHAYPICDSLIRAFTRDPCYTQGSAQCSGSPPNALGSRALHSASDLARK